MMMTRRAWIASVLMGTALLVGQTTLPAYDDAPIKVALLDSVFAGQDRSKVVEQIKPFADIMQKETATQATFEVLSLAQAEADFKKGKIQLVILSGLEYAWLHAQDKDIEALLVISIDPGATRTVFVTKQDDTAKELKDLEQSKVAVPSRVPYVSQFYVQRTIGQPMEKAFKLVQPGNVDETLEEVLDGKARAAMVTAAGLDVYGERNPGRVKKFKTIHQSPDFPQAAVMYHKKYADSAALEKFRKALLTSNEKPEGSRVLTLFKLKGFEAVPASYEKLVEETEKQFPRKGE